METQKLNEIKNIIQEYIKTTILGENKEAGRSHFLKNVEDPYMEILKILQRSWVKGESDSQIAKTYNVSYISIYRLRKYFEQYKEDLLKLIEKEIGEKKYFYIIKEENGFLKIISDYENVINFYRRYLRSSPKPKKRYLQSILRNAEKVWVFLNKKDPKDWSLSDVDNFLISLRERNIDIKSYVVAIRQIAPHLISQGLTTDWTKRSRTCDLFLEDVREIIKILCENGMEREAFIFKLHLSLGCREESFSKLKISDFREDYVDIYESKVKGGITWRNIKYTWLFDELKDDVKKYVNEDGKFVRNYEELRLIYKRISSILTSKIGEKGKILPHFARKIHVNILWQLGVPLELVAGQIIGNEGYCLFGVGWSDLNTLRKHYLSLSSRIISDIAIKAKEKAKEILQK
ncbi:MAG: hypothetical protein QXY65_06660 [Candidatus Methanomethylicaceae archaeon]